MLKRAFLVLVVVVIGVAMFAFTSVNTGTIDVDLLFTQVTSSVPVAFSVAFAAGWLFGLLCLSIWAIKVVNERRTLRRALRASESEVTSLRNLPMTDAD
jgi:uncharacterized membrane protein YciS (DUF1049 family)